MNLLHTSFKKEHSKHYLLLLLVCLMAYWPLTFGIFSVKNDAIHYFLPYRFHISEALRNGEWPFWSPYIYLGNPVYGDMQSGAWNPIVWLLSLAGRYDLTLFHFENLLYIFLGAVGMYKLVIRLVNQSQTALLIAASYMLSGFMLSGQLINWLASAAFIPFVLLYYLRIKEKSTYTDALKLGIALYLLLTAGYPSFFIITCYILLVLFALALIDQYKKKHTQYTWKSFALQHLTVLLVFTGLSLPAIISYADLLPYYDRGSGASYNDVIQNSFELKQLRSFLFPSSIKAGDLVSATDVTCRNLYMGLFILPVLLAFPPSLKRRNILLISLFVFAFLFSLGDATPFRKICYELVPLMDSFRHPSQARLFMILALLLLIAPGLNNILNEQIGGTALKKIKLVTWIITCMIAIICLMALASSGLIKKITALELSSAGFKKMLEGLTTNDVIAVNGFIQLAFLLAFIWWLRKRNRTNPLFLFLWISNLFIMAQLVLPVSFVSQTAPRVINQFIHASPKGFPVAGLENSLNENSRDALDHYNTIALTTFYNKKIGISKITNSPAFLQLQEQFVLNDTLYNYVAGKPVAYLADSLLPITSIPSTPFTGCSFAFINTTAAGNKSCDPTASALVKKLSANSFEIETHAQQAGWLILTQNIHRHWKAKVDGQPVAIESANKAFMRVPVAAGTHNIIFDFTPGNTIKALWVQGITVLLILVFTSLTLRRNRRLA